MSGQKCVACSKTMLMMDTKLAAGSGFYHKECFRCSHCSGQLTTLNFAQMNGVLYCKTHYTELFKLRGKYDDINSAPKGEDSVANNEGQGSAASEVPPVSQAITASESASTSAAAAAKSATVAKAALDSLSSPAQAAYPDRPVPQRVAPSAVTMVVAAAPAAMKVVAPAPIDSGAAGGTPRFGGSSKKCAVCTKTVYSAEPHIADGDKAWHKPCFKCANCNGQLSLTTWAQIDGTLLDKACYKKLFSARGKYDDVIATMAAKAAGAGGETPKEAEAVDAASPQAAIEYVSVPIAAPVDAEVEVTPALEAPALVEAAAAVEAIAVQASEPEAIAAVTVAAEVAPATESAPLAEMASEVTETKVEDVAAVEESSAPISAVPEADAEPASEPAPMPAPAAEPASAPAPVVVAGPKPVKIATPISPAPAPASSAAGTPRFGGSSKKCAVCTKTVYGAEPHIADGDKAWHKPCFKCANCNGQLSLTTWAQIDGTLLDKACYKKLFSARGKYDDVIAAMAAKAAGAGGDTPKDTEVAGASTVAAIV